MSLEIQMDTEIQDAIGELRDTIRGLEEIRQKMEKLLKKINKKWKEIERIEENLDKNRDGLEKLEEEIKRTVDELAKDNKQMEKLQKGLTTDEIKQLQVDREQKKEELHKKREQRGTILAEIEMFKSELNELRSKEPQWQEEINTTQNILQKSLFEVRALKALKFDFIDELITSKIESSLETIMSDVVRLLELENIVSDKLDDVRLLLLEKKERESGNEMLSVLKLCSNPIVKVVSTKTIIQKFPFDKVKVTKLEKTNREQILDDAKVLSLTGTRLESDILEILNFPHNCPEPVTLALKITKYVVNPSIADYEVAFKTEKEDWDIAPAKSEDGYVQFLPHLIQHCFVISRGKWKEITLSPEGFNYKSADVENVSATFPPLSVDKACKIEIQVMSPCPVEQTRNQEQADYTSIVSVSPRLWINHDDIQKFNRPVVVTLPIPSKPSNEEDAKLCLVVWTDDGDVYVSDANFSLTQTMCEFEVEHFSGTCVARDNTPSERRGPKWRRRMRNLYPYQGCGPRKPRQYKVKIVVFSDRSVRNTLWVDIVESKNVEERKQFRSSQSLVHIENAVSTDISLRDGQKIRISAGKGLSIPKIYEKDYMHIKFSKSDDTNYRRFQVEITKEASSAELAFFLDKKQVYVCPFEPELYLEKPKRMYIPNDQNERQDHGKFGKNGSMTYQSLRVLSEQIPVHQVKSLAIELDVPVNWVDDLKEKGYRGIELTLEVMLRWRRNARNDVDDMADDFVDALRRLSLNQIASILLDASKMKRPLTNEDFKE